MGGRYQDPAIEERKDVARPYLFIRAKVPVYAENGLTRKRQVFFLGYSDETTRKLAKQRKELVMGPINNSRQLIQAQVPFGYVLDKYLAVHVPTLGPVATLTYAQHIRLHIRPVFGKETMQHINKLAVQEWMNDKARSLSHNTLNDLRKVLHHIFSWAEDHKIWEGVNPCKKLKIGGRESGRSKELPTGDGLMRFLSAIKDTSIISAEGARLIVVTACATGMRISEVLALRPCDIDPVNETVRIERGWVRGNLGPTKTKDSRRVRQIPGLAADLLVFCKPKAREAFIFGGISGAGMPPDDRDLQQCVFRPAAVRAGIYKSGFGMHRFRHLNITWRQQAGASAFEAQKAAGHARPSTTWIYTHTDVERERAQVRAIMERLQGQPAGGVQ